jgi:hypothetical protein
VVSVSDSQTSISSSLTNDFFAVQERGSHVTKIECTHNANLCVNMTCTMSPISRFVINMTVGCTFVSTVPKIKVNYINGVKKSVIIDNIIRFEL